MFNQAYTNKSLIGNWFEDRQDTDQYDIPEPLLRTVHAARTPLVMPQPVDRPYESVHGVTYKRPVRQKAPNYTMHDKFTADRVLERRARVQPVWEGPVAPYESRNSRSLTTTSQVMQDHVFNETNIKGGSFHTTGVRARGPYSDAPTRPRRPSDFQVRDPAGVPMCGAEQMKLRETDPKEHTFVQRSWQYNRDLNQQHEGYANQRTGSGQGARRTTRPFTAPTSTANPLGRKEPWQISSFERYRAEDEFERAMNKTAELNREFGGPSHSRRSSRSGGANDF